MEILNGTHIELTKIVKYKGEYYNAKVCFYLADVIRLEASKSFADDKKCTKIITELESFRVKENYKKLMAIWLDWLEEQKKAEVHYITLNNN